MSYHKDDFPNIPVHAQYINKLIKKHKFTVGAELGVRRGGFCISLLRDNRELKMYAVDLWAPHADIEEHHFHDFHKETFHCRAAYHGLQDRVGVMQALTTEAAHKFGDETLDFIFADATHTSEAHRKDLEAWIPKVKKTGMISGHDYEEEWGMIPLIDSLGDVHVDEKSCSWHIMKKDLNEEWK